MWFMCFSSPGPGREAECQLEGHQEGARAMALVPASAPGKGGDPLSFLKVGLQDVSLHKLSSSGGEQPALIPGPEV